MPARSLTPGEIQLLQPIFGQTLPYDTQIVDTNDSNVGGIGNSITPNGTPYFSNNIWVMDFSVMIIPMISKWIFIHEFTHVWQVYHGTNPIVGAITNWLTYPCCYESSYDYDLGSANSFGSFNIEQQASIVADYWYVSMSLPPRHNTGPYTGLGNYQFHINQVQGAGPATSGGVDATTPGMDGAGF
jgi:hypothetical protein